jgi:predicted dehydrogenase
MDENRPLRIGVVGLGFGVDVHVPGFRSLPGVDVVTVLGKSAAKTAEVAKRIRVSGTTCNKLFFEHGLDAVSVAVPPGEVESIVNLCLEQNLPVLCEKPLGFDLATAKRLRDRARGTTTALDFEFAELETFAALRDLIDSGQIGSVRHIQITWLSESWDQRNRTWSWRTDATRHGGVLNLFGTHVLYLVELLAGPISAVSARLDSRATTRLKPEPTSRAAEDLVHATFDHASGIVTSMTIGNANPASAVHRWTVVGALGTAVLENTTRDYMAGFAVLAKRADGRILVEKSETKFEGDGRLPPFIRLARRFVSAIRTGTSCVPGFSQGARVQSLVDAIRLAALEKRQTPIGGAS